MKSISTLIITSILFITCAKQTTKITSNADGVYKIQEISLNISLNDNWKSDGKLANGPVTGYNFVHNAISDKQGNLVLPFIGIMFEQVPANTNILMYSMGKRTQLPPMKIIEVLSSDSKEFQLQTGVGYLGSYHDSNGVNHKIIVIHMINKTKGVQIIIDGTESVYQLMKKEYKNIINSINFNS
ncbi:MAG: hypothetical protein HQ562_00055 [Candidatus Marinimicrobia bacterium]|nr:hypothetical protein [Candidatus Neomarinimicrobiota bacterium]